MQAFSFYAPTRIYFGENCVKDSTSLIRSFGTKALIITTRFLGSCHNLALEDAVAAAEQAGIGYRVYEDVEENPSVESIVELARLAKGFGAEMVIGIGGGSAIDSAKAIGVLIDRLDEDPYQVFFGRGKRYTELVNMNRLPVIAISTTAGSGSEVTPNLILTRTLDGKKMCIEQHAYAEAAMLDPRYICGAPDSIFYSGVLDALAHEIESYINKSSTIGNRTVAEAGFTLFRSFKESISAMDRQRLTMADYGRILLHASVAGIAVGMNGSALPHGMGYPLSHEKQQFHGYASCICLPEYLKLYKDQELVSYVLSSCGFSGTDEFDRFISNFSRRFMDFTITPEEIVEWSHDLSSNEGRMSRHPWPLGYEDVLHMYTNALAPFTLK